ncbi:MAG: YraN family protein [Desulfobulbaceae bacterium]
MAFFSKLPGLFSGGSAEEAQKNQRQRTGATGEELAVSCLERKGYVVLERNYRRPFGEIDIIARDGETLVFIEVKTRRNTRYGDPLEAVDSRKQQRMVKAAQDYLSRNSGGDTAARFDVVAVLEDGGRGVDVRHVRNAFELEGWG